MAEQDAGQQTYLWVLAFLLVDDGGTAAAQEIKLRIELLETLCTGVWSRVGLVQLLLKLQE